MLRVTFEQKQQRLQDQVLIIGSQVEEILVDLVRAYKQQDIEQAGLFINSSRTISQECNATEADILTVLATQQPMADDLRFLVSTLEITLELARITEHIHEIGELTMKVGDRTFLEPLSDIFDMAKKVEQMLHRAMEAFARQDSHLAQTVARQDEGIDYLYQHIYQEMIAIIKVNPAAVSQAFDVSQVGHHLERIADRVTNVCEWVVFSVTGEMKELNGTIN